MAKFAARQPMLWTIAGHGRPDTEVWNHRGAGCSTCRYIFGSLHLTRQRRLFACPDKEQHHCFKKGNALRSFIHDEMGKTCSAGGGGNRAQCDESLSAVMVVLALSFAFVLFRSSTTACYDTGQGQSNPTQKVWPSGVLPLLRLDLHCPAL